jgi:hypothetical protein
MLFFLIGRTKIHAANLWDIGLIGKTEIQSNSIFFIVSLIIIRSLKRKIHLGGGEILFDCGGGERPLLATSAGL